MRIEFFAFNVGEPVGFNLSVAQLSGELKARGHKVRVSLVDDDVGLAWDVPALVERTAAFAPDVVAFSFASAHAPHARALVSAISRRLPSARTVLGGVHVTFAPDECLAWEGVTAVGRGECDGVLADFIDAWAAGEEAPRVPNFWVRRADGGVVKSPLGPLPALEGVSAFDEDIDVAAYTRASRGFGHVIVSRGCPYRCAYCFNHGFVERYAADLGVKPREVPYCRRRSVDDAVAEVQRLVRLAGGALKVVNFDDDTLVADKPWFLEFAARLKRDIGLPYVTNATVDRIDAEIAGALADTGCLLVKFGLETGSPRIARKVLRRGVAPGATRRAFRLLRKAGVNTRAYVMVGIPTESVAEARETLALCGSLEVDSVRPAWFQPYPGTPIHELCVREGLIHPGEAPRSTHAASPLHWEPAHALFLEKLMAVHSWVMSAALPENAAAAEYGALVDEVLAMDAATFSAPATRRWIRETSLALDRRLRPAGVPHYLNPFPDRREVSFLIRPDRRLPFPNVDDAWPPDAPWLLTPVGSRRGAFAGGGPGSR